MTQSSLILILLFLNLSLCFREEIIKTENVTISLRFKSVKCFVDDPKLAKLTTCVVKALSRTLTTINLGFEIFKDVSGPIDVINFISAKNFLHF